jgi:hypothetical protein
MSVTQAGVTHCGPLRYVVHLVGWMVSTGLATYGSIAFGTPHPTTWAAERPRYWRHEARQGLRACEAYLRRPPRSRAGENVQPT